MSQEHRAIDVDNEKSFYEVPVFCKNCKHDGLMQIQFGKLIVEANCTVCGCRSIQPADAPRGPAPTVPLGQAPTVPLGLSPTIRWHNGKQQMAQGRLINIHVDGSTSGNSRALQDSTFVREQAEWLRQMDARLPKKEWELTDEQRMGVMAQLHSQGLISSKTVTDTVDALTNSMGIPASLMVESSPNFSAVGAAARSLYSKTQQSARSEGSTGLMAKLDTLVSDLKR